MANPNKVGLAEALRQRELDEDEERDSSTDAADDWATGPDSPKKSAVPTRRLTRPGDKPTAPPPPANRPTTSSSVVKPQPAGAIASEKRPQSELGRACDAYEVDMTAGEFNVCKCGYKKADHVQSAAFRAAPKPLSSLYHPETKPAEKKPVVLAEPPKPAHVPDEPEEPESEGPSPCDAFEVDLQAKEFGTCKCGFKKHEHSKSAQLAAPKKPAGAAFASVQNAEKQAQDEKRREAEENKRKADEEAKAHQDFLERERKIREQEEDVSSTQVEEAEAEEPAAPAESVMEEVQTEEEGPKACDAFEIDLNAAEFGTCKCGFKKADHSKTALFSKPLPKGVHTTAPLGVPSVPSVKSAMPVSKPGNRAPPAFATAAPVKAVEPVAEPEPAEEAEEPAVEEEAPREEESEAIEEPQEEQAAGEQPAGEEEAAQTTVLDPPELYKALYDFDGQEVEDLSFKTDDIIEVCEILDADWMRGRIQNNDFTGVFPSNYVSKLAEGASAVEEPETAEEAAEPEPAEEVAKEEPEEEVAEPAETVQEEPEPEPVVEEAAPVEEVAEEAPAEEANVEEPPAEEAVAEEVSEEEPQQIEEAVEEAPVAEEEPLQEEAIVAAESEVPFTAYAAFDFTGESEDDLSFQTGDVIEVVGIVDAQWWRGVLNGHEGIFPAEFVSREAPVASGEPVVVEEVAPEEVISEEVAAVEEVPAAGSLGYVVALYDMEPQGEDDLPFKTDDQIEILEIIDGDWFRGSLNGTVGLVPRNYVSELHN